MLSIKSASTWSALSLIVANLIPIIGALFYAWDAKLVLALFWIENLIIGGFNLLKMVSVVVYHARYRRLFVCGFFVLHYGLFCTVHGLFLWNLLDLGPLEPINGIDLTLIGPLALFSEGAAVLIGFVRVFEPIIWMGIGALGLSHLVSFVENFILRGEIFTLSANQLMAQPYTQIVALHAGLIVGAIALEKLASPLWLLVVIVAFKLALDLLQHQKRHSAKTQGAEQIKEL